jgi:hypothetical protein
VNRSKERRQIGLALSRWFVSQDVAPADAAVIMGLLITEIIAALSQSKIDMDEGVRTFVADFKDGAEKIKNRRYRGADV